MWGYWRSRGFLFIYDMSLFRPLEMIKDMNFLVTKGTIVGREEILSYEYVCSTRYGEKKNVYGIGL